MAVSRSVVEQHVAEWTRRLGESNRPYRRFWPRLLFRHEPIENASHILKSGILLSRRAAEDANIHRLDIAAPSVISRRDEAHDFARLYFRPRNPTQYWIEGVRRPDECRDGVQAAMLVMFVFNSDSVLVKEGVQFSNGNMQADRSRTQVGHDDEFFQGIDFEKVYHEGPYDSQSPSGWDITRSRNAEVLTPSPLSIGEHLRAVVCRTVAERSTLLHFLGGHALLWAHRIVVESAPGLFFREKAFVEAVEADSQGVTVSFNPRKDGQVVSVSLKVVNERGVAMIEYSSRLDLSRRWRWNCALDPGSYTCRLELEGLLAHQAKFLIDEGPF